MKFSRKYRLRAKADYQYVFSRPIVSRDRYFRVLRRANNLEFGRLGMAVSRKICRRAVGRNRLKRLIRESFRQFGIDQEIARGFDFVVLPTGDAATICNRTLSGSLEAHWLKARKNGPGKNDMNSRKNQ